MLGTPPLCIEMSWGNSSQDCLTAKLNFDCRYSTSVATKDGKTRAQKEESQEAGADQWLSTVRRLGLLWRNGWRAASIARDDSPSRTLSAGCELQPAALCEWAGTRVTIYSSRVSCGTHLRLAAIARRREPGQSCAGCISADEAFRCRLHPSG